MDNQDLEEDRLDWADAVVSSAEADEVILALDTLGLEAGATGSGLSVEVAAACMASTTLSRLGGERRGGKFDAVLVGVKRERLYRATLATHLA